MSSLSVKSMDPHPMHHNCHPLWKILFAFLEIFFALRSTTGYKVCILSTDQRLFTKTQMWEWWFENEIERGLVCWSDVRRESYCAGREELAIVGESGQFVSQQSTTRMSAPPGCTNVCATVPMCAPPGCRTPFKVVQSTNLHHLHCTTNIFIEGSRDKLGKTIAIHHSWEPAKCSKCGHNLWLTRESSRNCCCPTTTPTPLHTLFLLIRSIVCIHWRCNSYLVYWSSQIILHCALVHCTCTATIAANMVDHCFAIYFCYFTNTHPGSNTNHWACKLQHVQLFLLDLIFKLYLWWIFNTKKVFPMKLQWMERAGICLITMSDCYRLYFHCVPSLLCCR